jgi:hypothetical protein
VVELVQPTVHVGVEVGEVAAVAGRSRWLRWALLGDG